MEYTDKEQQVLSLMKRTDFKNISKSDLVSFASKISEMRPEVAKEVIAQFPELASLIRSSMTEYKGILENIVSSDDGSLKQVNEIYFKELDSEDVSRQEYNEMASKVLDDLSKTLEKNNLTPEERKDILDQEMEILKMVDRKDSEVREHKMETVRMADKKDTEKRQFNWGLIKGASFVVMAGIAIGVSALGGDIKLKLPTKH